MLNDIRFPRGIKLLYRERGCELTLRKASMLPLVISLLLSLIPVQLLAV